MNSSTENKTRSIQEIVYPEGEFSIADLAKSNPHVSKVTLSLRIHKSLKENTLQLIGNRKAAGKGRPANIFSLTSKS